MQVTAIQKQADFVVVVKMRIGQQEITIAFHKMHGNSASSDQNLRDDTFHGLAKFDPDGIGVLTNDLDAADRGKPFVLPGMSLHGHRRCSPLMIADHTNRRPRASHDDSRGSPLTTHGPDSLFCQIKDQRFGNPIRPLIQPQHPIPRIERMLQSLGIVRHSIADRTEPKNIRHAEIPRIMTTT